MGIKRDPKLDEKQISAFAYKVLKRVHALGAKSQTIDDIKSELWIAWCIACENYDPNGGASFSTYLYSGMRLHINRWVEKSFTRFHGETIAFSLDAPLGEEGSSLSEIVPSHGELQSDAVERESCYDFVMSRLSERAKTYVSLLKDTPQEVSEQIQALDAKRAHARSLGITAPVPTDINSAILFDLMGASRFERQSIMNEIRNISDLVSR